MIAYHFLNDAKVTAISDINSDRARLVANRHEVNRIFTNYIDLLELEDLDFVDVCTPTTTHVRIVCDAAKMGHDVLVEKPMARTVYQCQEMIRQIKKNSRKLCICHNQLFYSSVQKAKSLLESGRHRPLSLRTVVNENTSVIRAPDWVISSEEGGVLWEVGCHAVYLQLYFLPPIIEVYAVGSKVKHSVFDSFAVILKASDLSYGVIEVNLFAKEPERYCEIASTDGTRVKLDLDVDYLLDKSRSFSGGITGLISRYLSDGKQSLKKNLQYSLNLLRYRQAFDYLSHINLIARFIESLNNNSAPPVTPEDGIEVIQLLQSIERSLRENEAVRTSS